MGRGLATGMLLREVYRPGASHPIPACASSPLLTSPSKPGRWDLRKANFLLCLGSFQWEQQGSKTQRGYS